jgi:hypothetical protein
MDDAKVSQGRFVWSIWFVSFSEAVKLNELKKPNEPNRLAKPVPCHAPRNVELSELNP